MPQKKYIPVILFAIFSLIYLLFLSEVASLTHDSITYANEIENFEYVYHPHHLLYHVLSLLWYKLLLFIGIGGASLKQIASLNAFFGAAGISLIYLILTKNFKIDAIRAILFSAIAGTSFGYWFYSISVEVYIIPLFFILLSFKLFLDEAPVFYLGIVAAVAVLFHQVHCLFGIVILINLLLKDYGKRSKIKNAIIFSLFYATFIILPYIAVMWHLQISSLSDIEYWLTKYHHEVNSWNSLSPAIIAKDIVGFSRTLISPYGLFQIDFVRNALVSGFQGKDFNNEVYLLRNISSISLYIYSLLLGIFSLLYLYLVILAARNFKSLLKNDKMWIFLIFLVIYGLFFSFWDSANVEFWIPQSTLIWIILAVATQKRRVIIAAVMLGSMILINLIWAILPAQNINNDFYYAKAKSTEIMKAKEMVVLDQTWINEEYFNKHTDLKVVNSKNFNTTTNQYLNEKVIISEQVHSNMSDSLRKYYNQIKSGEFVWYVYNSP